MEALEDLINRLEQGRRLSWQQQAFINDIASGGGNLSMAVSKSLQVSESDKTYGQYWPWFMELKCAVAVVEQGM